MDAYNDENCRKKKMEAEQKRKKNDFEICGECGRVIFGAEDIAKHRQMHFEEPYGVEDSEPEDGSENGHEQENGQQLSDEEMDQDEHFLERYFNAMDVSDSDDT